MNKSEFRSDLGEHIFRQKYAQGPSDTWANLSQRVVDDVCGPQKNMVPALMGESDRKQLVQYIKEMKFIPGGRYLYYAGRPNHFFNNCFTRDTEFITDKGIRSFRHFEDGVSVNILSPITNGFLPATVKFFGHQECQRITFKNVRGKSLRSWQVDATANHRWPLMDGRITENLQVGDVVPASGLINKLKTIEDYEEYWEGLRHGLVFADGNVHKGKEGFSHQLRLCGYRKSKMVKYFEEDFTITYPASATGDPVVYINSDFNLKELPSDFCSINYIYGFLQGWLDFDGYNGTVSQIHSINENAINFFSNWCWVIGRVVSGNIRIEESPTNFGERTNKLFYVNHRPHTNFQGFKVVDIQSTFVEDVWCVIEPEHHQFTLKHGIATGNCYLLRAEADSREEWANIAWRATSCLMTGGGIGVDYSILRGKGKPIARTGGVSSGPLSLMHMVNEIGRNVMQGGSRRSAIYASLNWQHDDIHDFLAAKNWSDDIKAGKNKDFNASAPLDMTNVSINYDDAALNIDYDQMWPASNRLSTNPIFLENCKQAMMTGEPGFSFNFGDKQNETLRNACTEVTSEDDSDVCNLGSINLGNISSMDEFRSVVQLASKFLVCGTLRADLPYEKVYKVREKNRRLGLGLMGIHEWLLKKGSGYEVTPELHTWLEVYKDESIKAANEHCSRLYISNPVAYRAIAPTGTIGILAGTTTGIEPLFAVAYKRRYLTDGTKWKYEYCVDATASILIQQGINPDNIQTAYGLSSNYEQRIKFQADVQDYVDMSISSTINLPSWGSKDNNESCVSRFAKTLSMYAPRLRGFTCYPDGSRGGQPLTEVPYEEAIKHKGIVFEDNIEASCKSGVCGI